MSPNLSGFLWVLASGASGAFLGLLFGAFSGAMYWASGKASGTRAAHRVLEAITRIREQEFPRGTAGGIVGGVDGFLFLGLGGTFLGLLTLYAGWTDLAALLAVVMCAAALALTAAFFGMLAYATVRAGAYGVAGLVVGGFTGAGAGFLLVGSPGLVAGVVAGLSTGILTAWLARRR